MIGGFQILFFNRSCENDQSLIEGETCHFADTSFSVFKDCAEYCNEEDGCNDGKDVELHFSKLDDNGKPVKQRCFAYRADLNSTTVIRDIT